tara:strand:- start:3 stop:278 length:276 start_codon:yes stop_codon:yes gene_type:complete
MKKIIAVLIIALAATTAQAKNVYIEDEKVSSHSMCVLKAGFAISSLRSKGAKTIKVVDSIADQTFLYKIKVGNNTGFVSCSDREYKVWLIK